MPPKIQFVQSFINPTLTMLPFERIGEMVSELSVERKIQLYNMLKGACVPAGHFALFDN
jgi:hypothetical protein